MFEPVSSKQQDLLTEYVGFHMKERGLVVVGILCPIVAYLLAENIVSYIYVQ